MKNILLVFKEKTSVNFVKQIANILDKEKYEIHILDLGENDFQAENVTVKTFENTYLDQGFKTGLIKCFKKKKFKYLPILIKEKLFKRTFKKDRINKVLFQGKYNVAVSCDLESCAFVGNNVLGKIKILRYPFGTVDEPFLEDFNAAKKFTYFVLLKENIKSDFAKEYEVDEEKIKVIPNITNLESLVEKSQEFTIEKSTKFVFTSLCRLASLSQIDFVIETVENMLKLGFRDFLWHIVGGTEDLTATQITLRKKKIEKYINFVEKQENPYPFVKVCDIYAQVSDIDPEAFSMEMAELLGKPVLALETEISKKFTKNLSKKNSLEFAKKLIYMSNNLDKFPVDAPVIDTENYISKWEECFEKC